MRAILIVALSLSSFYVAKSQADKRTLTQTVTSAINPSVAITIDTALSFIGRVEMNVDTVGKAEEYIFSDVENGKLGRSLIIHFEHFLSGNDYQFDYPRFRMAKLGEFEYLHQIWYLEDFDLMKRPELKSLFDKRGIGVSNGWLVNRYVRSVDKAKKYELIIFYMEPENLVSDDIKKLGMGNPTDTKLSDWQIQLKKRASSVFTITKG